MNEFDKYFLYPPFDSIPVGQSLGLFKVFRYINGQQVWEGDTVWKLRYLAHKGNENMMELRHCIKLLPLCNLNTISASEITDPTKEQQ